MNTTASITRIASELRPWTARNGSVRYYVNDWKALIGMNIKYHGTGNVKSVQVGDEYMSNHGYKKYVERTKVWFDEDAGLHIDYCESEWIAELITEKVTARFSEEN
jgi:hypothetical protein